MRVGFPFLALLIALAGPPAQGGFSGVHRSGARLVHPALEARREDAVARFYRKEARYQTLDPGEIQRVTLLTTDPGTSLQAKKGHTALRFSRGAELSPDDLVVNMEALLDPNDLTRKHSAFTLVARNTVARRYPSHVWGMSYADFADLYSSLGRGIWNYRLALDADILQRVLISTRSSLKSGRARRSYQIFRYNCSLFSAEKVSAGLSAPFTPSEVRFPDRVAPAFRRRGLIDGEFYDPPLDLSQEDFQS